MTAPGKQPNLRADTQVHVTLADGRAFSLAVSTLTLSGGARLSRASLTDVARRRCATRVIGDPRVPSLLRDSLDEPSSRHPLVRRALAEVLAAGRLPYPDTIGTPTELADTGDGLSLRVEFPDQRIACEFVLARALRSPVEGTITIDGTRHPARGTGTYVAASDSHEARAIVQLDDGAVVHAWRDGTRVRAAIGDREYDATLTPLAIWTSHYTFHDFGVAWRLLVPDAHVDVELRATFDEQELVTMTASEPLWRGRCDVLARGRHVGVACLEHAALDPAATLSDFFATIPRETRRVIERQLPLPSTTESMLAVLGDNPGRYARDFDPAEFQRVLIQPIREVVDRMGKAWRSYSAVMCYHALRGDPFRRDSIEALLSLTEVIHVGSLIVDDVEDNSPTRRGGPSCHVAHGVPLAINAGTFCYFAWQAWFARLGLPDAARLQIYERYFEFMRLAHLGQAMDIQGFTPSMTDEVVVSGDVAKLTRELHNIYVFKTGAPASIFARIAAIVAGGDDTSVRAIGELFEALGIAFQIMDDVQNLKGFVGDPKHCEDLTQAKVTMPVLEAMRALDQAARRDLWTRIQQCGQQPALIPAILETLERCGAFTACRDQASGLIETAWTRASPLLDDSIAKIMLRSFCFYVVECLS